MPPIFLFNSVGDIGEEALEQIWNVAKKSTQKLNVDYLKYLRDIRTPSFGWATTDSWRTTFDRAFPNLRNNVPMQVHHAIPREVLTRYAHLGIDPKQMHSLLNLRGIPNNIRFPIGAGPNDVSTSLHNHITQLWRNYFDQLDATNTLPDMDDLVNFAKSIDDQFGQYFNPPVR